MTTLELRDEMIEKRAQKYYQRRCWHWRGPSETIKLGVISGLGGCWIIGHITESGSHRAFKSTALSKHYPSDDPNTLSDILTAWATGRHLRMEYL